MAILAHNKSVLVFSDSIVLATVEGQQNSVDGEKDGNSIRDDGAMNETGIGNWSYVNPLWFIVSAARHQGHVRSYRLYFKLQASPFVNRKQLRNIEKGRLLPSHPFHHAFLRQATRLLLLSLRASPQCLLCHLLPLS